MLAALPRVPLLAGLAVLVGLVSAFLLAPIREPPERAPPVDPTLTIRFVPGTAVIVAGDLATLPAYVTGPHDRVVIASEQTSAEPDQLADRRVEAIADVLRARGEASRIVVVTTEIAVAGEPPAAPTDNATVELRP